jgi:hypothetical protein
MASGGNTAVSLPQERTRPSLARVRDFGVTPESLPTKAYYPGKFSAFRALCRKTFLFCRIMSESFPLKQMLDGSQEATVTHGKEETLHQLQPS